MNPHATRRPRRHRTLGRKNVPYDRPIAFCVTKSGAPNRGRVITTPRAHKVTLTEIVEAMAGLQLHAARHRRSFLSPPLRRNVLGQTLNSLKLPTGEP
jgi:hypothetical protein